MRLVTTSRLAWGVCGLLVVATIGGQLAAVSMGATGDLFLVFMLSFPLVGTVLASRRPENAIGWIMLGIGGVAVIEQVLLVYADVALEGAGAASPLPALALALRDGLWVPLIGLPGTFLLLLFPVDGDLAVACSTLAAAAAFNPLRRRIQTAVDHRFNRDRYDAARIVERFTERLRSPLEIHELAAALTNTVRDAVQPASVSTWLSETGELPPAPLAPR